MSRWTSVFGCWPGNERRRFRGLEPEKQVVAVFNIQNWLMDLSLINNLIFLLPNFFLALIYLALADILLYITIIHYY